MGWPFAQWPIVTGRGAATAIRATFVTMNFASDNTAGIDPAILDAIAAANRGYARGYGNDDWTQAAERKLSRSLRARGRASSW